MRKRLFILLLAASFRAAADEKPKLARNVILLLADAAGVPTISAASLFGYQRPQALYIQSWSHIGMSDTSTASDWVTDSAAGMTAIMTGRKTQNGVISQGPDAVRGRKDGVPLKTLLEYAEERGLSTGVLSNVTIADATPAACFAHVSDRGMLGEIFLQLFSPRFGDGVDVLAGPGRKPILASVSALGKDLSAEAAKQGRAVYSSLDEIPSEAQRFLSVTDGSFDLDRAAMMAIRALSKNRKGYFLMIESDAHTDRAEAGLTRLVNFDKLIREIAGMVDLNDTLLLFTADHSFDLRVRGGGQGEPLLKIASGDASKMEFVRVDDSHTGEEVLVLAQGPGAERVNGFFPNTEIFRIMMAAYGWPAEER